MSNIIPARERSRVSAEDPRRPAATIAFFDVPVIPHIPLQMGQNVKILALVSCADLFPTDEQYKPKYYTTRETGVEGKVERVRAVDATITEFVVRNDNPRADVTYAYVAIQHIQGRTVSLSLGRRLLRAVTRPTTMERQIPLELDATIFWDNPANQLNTTTSERPAPGAGPVERRVGTAGRSAKRVGNGSRRECVEEPDGEGEDEASSAGDTE
ncbi:hypothetical protein TRAPUB_10321 [Trametes pubescens]|uniref:Uncharacterized protein n=1 Tax=Trametes pubescens TaxID=154538 RepID=A0A1M2W055_TRAPU|nr:hypothetical protein TRAPUB_1786 [Trametes pubescens]OJT07442.1 hypothetical protein TRAPUB_1685 [Trametes pubescens]OJT07464.1 hypothetical protein TRAPUB_1649 [Trametes pubescens]OJT13166.1 hypothetical protein TRAPUB_10321 [Trametes pubescens]